MSNPHPRRAINLLFAANGISLTGNVLALLAIPWFVLVTTGSASQTGITAFFTLLPMVIATFFGGTLVDRVGFKVSSISADIASGLTVLLIPLLFSIDMLPFWLLQVLVFLGALLDTPGSTARQALLPELAGDAGMSLERVSSITQIVERSSRLLGAPVAGFLIALVSAQNVLYINALSFAVSALMVWIFVPNLKVTASDEGETVPASYLDDLRSGIEFIRGDRLMIAIVTVIFITNAFDVALSSVIYPVFVNEVYGSATGLGLLFGVSGGGAVIGALAYGKWGEKLSRWRVYSAAWIGIALARVVLIFLPPLWLLLCASLFVGLAAGPLNPIMSTVSYERIPADMRARVLGITASGSLLAMPLGVLLAGYGLEWLGLQPVLVIVVAGYMVTALAVLFNRRLREMDDAVPVSAELPTSSL